MDLHERYARTATIDFSIFQFLEIAFESDPFLFLHQMVKYYNAQIIKNNLSEEKLSTYRMILCYEYQLVFNAGKKYNRTLSNDLCFRIIENVLFERKYSQSELLIIHDIVILQLILYCNPQCTKQHLLNLKKSNGYSLNNDGSKFVYMKILECFLESLQLTKFLYNGLETNVLESFSTLYLEDILTWLQMKENKEWQLFASIFPKLVNTFNSENVLQRIWNCILNELDDVKDKLCALTIVTDVIFSLKLENTSFLHNTLCCTEQLWLLIVQNLKSSVQQYRKQALFIMRRITDFMSTADYTTLKLENIGIIPFVCNHSTKTKVSIHDIKKNYFLILEALEEKQHHLILPALTLLPILVKGSNNETECSNCLSNMWLQLIFERMLQHENGIIVKQGILHVCNFPALVYDEQFLKLFVHVLNTTSLYECQTYQQEPEIINNIVTLFISAKEERVEFLNTVLQIINEETWAPIPIFYMMKVLRAVSSNDSNHWGNNQLILVKSLVQKNLNIHSPILRIASQIELLQTISFSTKNISNLEIVLDTLLEFPSEETLVRNSFPWNTVVTWLKTVLLKAEAVNFISVMCKDYLCQDSYVKLNPAKFALVVAMFHDADLILQLEKCPAKQVLNDWLSSLKGIDSRPYANNVQILFTIEFMSHMLNLNSMKTIKSIIQLLSLYINDALTFLLRNCRSIPYKYSYEEINRYLNTIVLLFNNGKSILSEREVSHYIEKLKNESIIILENIKQYTILHYMCALYILHYTQSILCINPKKLYLQPLLNICDIHIPNSNESNVKLKGKIASDCYILLARLLNQFFTKADIELWPQEVSWFNSISYLYEMGGNEIVPEVASILKTIVDKGLVGDPQNKLNLETIFTICWRTTLLNTKNKTYFAAIQNLLKVIINNKFLTLPNMNFVHNFIDQLLEESDNVPKLKRLLLNEMESLNICHLWNVHKPLVSCLLHGYALRKDKHIENQVYMLIAQHYRNFYPQHTQIIDYNSDANIRAFSIVLLHKIINEDKKYASMLLPIMLQKLEKYKNKRYFNHSYIHKIKHRIMQTLLIMQPILAKEDIILLQEFLSNSILVESNQHSVRIMQEWLLIKIFIENTELHNNLWEFFEKGITTRPGCISSIVYIVYHVSKFLRKDSQSNFVTRGLNYIVRCCLGQQYSMRLHSQIIFVKLYEMLEETNGGHSLLQYKGMYDATILNLKDGLAKNSSKILDHFYLSIFHIVQDYSLQTIYFELPRLTDMDASEWITPHLFQILNFSEIKDHPLKLYNVDTSLSDIKVSSYLTKSSGDTELSVTTHCTHQLDDIQKKINPLISKNLGCSDIFPTIRESISHKRSLLIDEGLIVVACLVNRIPNLGGLARTCEIFNVKELVISNLNQIKDKEFQNLSVSAENWITITETKPHELCKYLLNKKELGWSLVGLEQTANSKNLLNMKFEKKTVLILGNEKDGIPANLIPLFDTCIEIPQIGVIRSLNVHVSGAICIWQYAKQHIFT